MDDHTFYTQYLRQVGSGQHDIGTIYSQNRYVQRGGGGFGNVFHRIFDYLKPILMSGLNLVKNQGIKSTAQIIQDIGSGLPMREILKSRGQQALNEIRDTVVKKIQGGAGKLKRKIKRLRKRKNGIKASSQVKTAQLSSTNSNKKKSKSTKKRILDIFT